MIRATKSNASKLVGWGQPNRSEGDDGARRDSAAVVADYISASSAAATDTLKKLTAAFPAEVLDARVFSNEVRVEVKPEAITQVLSFLRDDPDLAYKYLSQIAGAEWYPALQTPKRFLYVSYDLYSFILKSRLSVYVLLPKENPSLPTVSHLFKTADWHEREVFDLFGVNFAGHPDLRRILLPPHFDGHPLLKDYPARGKDVWELGTNVVPGDFDEIIGTIR